MTTATKQEIEMIMVDTNNEIIDMLAEIKKRPSRHFRIFEIEELIFHPTARL